MTTPSSPTAADIFAADNFSSFKPGFYRHYKGDLYFAIGLAETHNHNGDRDVVYISLSRTKLVTRPYWRDSRNEDCWVDIVMWPDGIERPRFLYLDAPSA